MTDTRADEGFEAWLARLQAGIKDYKPALSRVRRRPDRNFAGAVDDPSPPAAPSKDWRDAGVIGPVRDQGTRCSACASFAIAAVIEALLRLRDLHDQTEVDAGFIHTCVALAGNPDCRYGADLGPLVDLVVAGGYAVASAQTTYPFPAGQCAATPRRQIGPRRPLPGPNAVKNALMQAPVAAEIYGWPDFTAYHCQQPVYAPSQVNGAYYHCVCIIGFNPQGWIIKNSYGPAWGCGGFATIAYNTCGLFGARRQGRCQGRSSL